MLNRGRYKIKDSDKTKIPRLKDIQMEVGFLGGRSAYRSLKLDFTREDGEVYHVENVRLATESLSPVEARKRGYQKMLGDASGQEPFDTSNATDEGRQDGVYRVSLCGSAHQHFRERAPVYTRTHFLFVNMVKVSDGTIFGILPADEETINYSLLNLRDGDVHEQPTSFGEVLTEFKDNRKRKADEDDEDDDVVEVPSQRIVTPDRLRPSQKISRGSEQGQRLLRYPTKFGDLKDYTPAPTGV
ncbi:hypothetical protein FOZ61_008352 [Perkinsus olseni]|uniref:Uncharacterized protein n=1 Tax=Perkinsus olseni TaxID=32597 RepID=A0A7J6L511_PEROL|nr:hypothetical protein FOZ61_008352 [Perkinsus olseni]